MTFPTPENTPGQQDNSGQQAPAGYIEKARYDGLVRKVEELTLAGRTFQTELASKTSEIEQLKTQLGIKETEKSAAVSERDAKLQEYVQKATGLESEISELRAMKLKMDVAREIGRPELLKVAESIPNMTDREALKTVMSSFAGLLDDAVKDREKQLLAGYTPPPESRGTTPPMPTTQKEWDRVLNNMTPGTPEYENAMDQFWNWSAQSSK